MKTIALFVLLLGCTLAYSQSLPIDFESLTTQDFVDFDGGVASVIANPHMNGSNTSENVAQIVRSDGAIWAGSKIFLSENLDFTTDNILSMKVYTTAPVGTVVKFKLEGDANTERDVTTTVSGEWETLSWDFTGEPRLYNTLVFMFDFGQVGDGSETSTFLFDDIEQLYGGKQIDWPVTFEDEEVNYTTTDFGGNISALVADPENPTNTVVQVIKTNEAATWSGTTIGTPAGFATPLPLSLTEARMTVRVWSPESGTPIRLKVEDSNDPTHTCETETNTTVGGEWEVIEFDFLNQAPGTELLSIGVERGWIFNMASIFMDFGTEGAAVGAKTYYFDEVRFGNQVLGTSQIYGHELNVFPNPSLNSWTITNSADDIIEKIAIYKPDGQIVLSKNPRSSKVVIPARDLVPGLYFAKIWLAGKIAFQQLVRM